MNIHSRNRITLRSVLGLAVVAMLAAFLSGCGSTRDSSEGFHAEIAIHAYDATTRPVLFADINQRGDKVVFASAAGEVKIRHGSLMLWHELIPANYAHVRLKESDVDWTGAANDPLPAEARPWFTDEEILLWQMTFQESSAASTLSESASKDTSECHCDCRANRLPKQLPVLPISP